MKQKVMIPSPEYNLAKIQLDLLQIAIDVPDMPKDVLYGDFDGKLSELVKISFKCGYIPEVTFKQIK